MGRRFQLVMRVGARGRVHVHRAVDVRDGRGCVVQLVSSEGLPRRPFEAFVRHAARTAYVKHPNVAPILEANEEAGYAYVAMPRLAGEHLSQTLARGPLPIHEAVAVAADVARGLAAAHDHRLFHLRVEAECVWLHEDPKAHPDPARRARRTPKVGGFGLAHLPDDPSASSVSALAPEQRAGQPGDERADVWGVGVLLAQMIAGTSALEGDRDAALADTLDSLGQAPLGEILGEMLSQERARRPHLRVVARRLREVARHLDGSPRPTPVRPPPLPDVSRRVRCVTSGSDEEWSEVLDSELLPSVYPRRPSAAPVP